MEGAINKKQNWAKIQKVSGRSKRIKAIFLMPEQITFLSRQIMANI